MNEWQPIHTAPKDGTAILSYDGKGQFVLVWHSYLFKDCDRGWWHLDNGYNNEWQPEPTHWMPLPEPPAP